MINVKKILFRFYLENWMREREGEEAGIRCGGEEEEVEMDTFSFFQFCSFFSFLQQIFLQDSSFSTFFPKFPYILLVFLI